ncbi:tRNA (adenine(58)-N(1))-methyltransferase, mitochondrial isoform X1 [Anguilla anguilla]|uniref:tRNA (adenine(58)-N(1))-methyltransferase, mitochondrial isoform X1 n=1 Tax=Anguilla anguilla TaxID=7936 RepID=UPI0015AE993D|nr:tRNA (adenine(58)-N(1))-methyltransferase, mitochondrial isoform X1 [Anguilla anguilla]XP_035259727.1 tRNA (adenine(58)-N(1))-methyltransferase, mitochondrial isoform X1 [Anguilla anguilla]XP_035259737.1 tRNA (adenine(58)-N(1))-methyltransferase, mitochondrial isoform X1 [Anguilla anguilla]
MGRTCWRLLQVWINTRGQHCYSKQPLGRGILPQTLCLRNIGSGGQDDSDGRNGSYSPESPQPSLEQLRTRRQPFGRLGGRGRPLSPLERISRLLPQDTLSQEVWELREGKEEDEVEGTQGGTGQGEGAAGASEGETPQVLGDRITDAQQQEKRLGERQEEERHAAEEEVEVSGIGQEEKPDPAGGDPAPALPGERPLIFGEIALAEYRKKGRLEFQKMFPLQEGGLLNSTWGLVPHSTMVGRPAGSTYLSSTGSPFLVRRPNLEEYVLFMKRGPTIAYPKDASAMLMMMDVTEGDCVLESGSGSGAMSLFLSRAVGTRGSVLSVEVREDHHRRAVANYHRWRTAWRLRRGEEWPDNVRFHNTDLRTATHLLAGQGFHSIALDMLNPHLVLPVVFPHLHNGAVCAVYLANVTQVIDLLEGIRFAGLPLMCERVLEVQLRDWLLAPAVQRRDGKHVTRIAPSHGNQEEEEARPDEERGAEESRTNEIRPFGALPYIARPHPEQGSHTAFLVKLRKVLPP